MSQTSRGTNVRSNMQSWVRMTMGTLDKVSPAIAARAAETLFLSPPPTPLSRDARRALRQGERFTVLMGEHSIAAWSWGDGPVVLLVHGWGGRASQMRPYVQSLVEAGYRAVAFDAPGHGETGGGASSLLHFKSAVQAVAARLGGVFGVVAHSLGAAAVVLSLREGLRPARLALLGAPAWPVEFTYRFGAAIGVQSRTIQRMQRRIESRFAFRWDNLNIPEILRTNPVPLLVVHDEDDTDVPLEEARVLAAAPAGGQLVVTRGLGHRNILRDRKVVHQVVDFVTDGAMNRLCVHGRHPERCPGCSLEADLFAPDRRR